LHVSFIFSNRNAITNANWSFKKQNESRNNVGGNILQTKTDTHGEGGKYDSDRREVNPKQFQRYEHADYYEQVSDEAGNCVTQPRIEMRAFRNSLIQKRTYVPG
jgi:hypothetical protein